MLKTLRKKTKLIIWTVIISFALWGGFSVSTQFQKEGRLAGEIFGRPVTFQEFDAFYRASQIFSFSGKNLDDPEALREQTWQNIILAHEAKRQKMEVSDDEVREEIFRLLKHQGIEKTQTQAYEAWLRNTLRETPRQFEEKVREFIRIQKLIRTKMQGPPAPFSEDELQKLFHLDQDRAAFELIRFSGLEEADAFRQKHGASKSWEKFGKENPGKVEPYEMKILREALPQWKITESEVQKLYELSKDAVSEPIASGGGHLIFRMTAKETAGEDQFESWRDQFLNQYAYQNFLRWVFHLRQSAGLKDYLPHEENPVPESVKIPAGAAREGSDVS